MKWYVASIIVSYRLTVKKQELFPIDELFTLFYANNRKEAWEKAIRKGKEYNNYDESLRINGNSAYAKYEGIRKVIEIIDDEFELKIPLDGLEISSSYMELTSIKDIEKLAKGKAVIINYIDMDE